MKAKLKTNYWYRINQSEGGGLLQTTDAMLVNQDVVVIRNTTLVQGPNTVSESMTTIPAAGICSSGEHGRYFEVCSPSRNEAVD